ncbi:MAG: TlpA disulfide reductase family protein, partial [Bacteroidota bacterium]
FTTLRLAGVDCQDEDEEYWYLGNQNPKLMYELHIRKRDSLITWVSFKRTDKKGEYYYEYHRFDKQEYDRELLTASPPMAMKPNHWREQAYQTPNLQASPEPLQDVAAPAWTCLSTEEDSLSLTDFEGQYVLLDFWYIGCGPCALAMPGLQALSEEFDSSQVRVIGVETNTRSVESVAAYMEQRGASYTSIIAAKTDLPSQYQVSAYPTFFLIDPEGKIVHHQVGYSPGEIRRLRKLLTKVLKD